VAATLKEEKTRHTYELLELRLRNL